MTMKNYFFKTIKCHNFSEPQARPDLNDDNNNNNINEDNKEEEDEDDNEKLFFSKLSSVILFRNHKLNLI